MLKVTWFYVCASPPASASLFTCASPILVASRSQVCCVDMIALLRQTVRSGPGLWLLIGNLRNISNQKMADIAGVCKRAPASNKIAYRKDFCRLKYLSQDEASNLDQELFTEYGFSVDQLMELAGLSVAHAIYKTYPPSEYERPVVICGPGNNGGDGLVAARHMKLLGYSPSIVYFKPGRTQLYENLLRQCTKYGIEIRQMALHVDASTEYEPISDIVVDALFGFSYKPPVRNEEYVKLLKYMRETSKPVVSIDVPSGWDVNEGPRATEECIRQPSCLISLTAPKLCARHFEGRYHYLGGRFCPQSIQDKYGLNLPQFQATESVILLNEPKDERAQ